MMSTARDRGVVTPVELMYLLVFVVASLGLLVFLGRLHTAAVDVSEVAQAAARAASMEGSGAAATAAAQAAVARSGLSTRCTAAPSAEVTWQLSPSGTWHGGSVSVRVRCTVPNAALAVGLLPGARTIAATDTQPIDRYQR